MSVKGEKYKSKTAMKKHEAKEPKGEMLKEYGKKVATSKLKARKMVKK